MDESKPSYDELKARLDESESLVESLKKRLAVALKADAARDLPPASDGPLSDRIALTALSEALIKLNRSGSIQEMCLFAADCVFQLNPKARIVISLYDSGIGAITIRNFLGFGGVLDACLKLLGRDPRKMSFSRDEMTDEEKKLYTSGSLEVIPEGFYSLLNRKVPRWTCRSLESLLRVEKICCMGFSLDDLPYGGMTILERKGAPLRSGLVIEILAHQISMAIHRRRAEEEREALQAQLNQAQKMESVGRLAGGVAHDFNNMLGVILGHSELALSRMEAGTPFRDNFREIRSAAERSANLTRQLLAFARKQTIAPKVLDLNSVVEGMITMLRRLIGEDIELEWLPGSGLWPVKVDPSQLDQVLANLCINARDAVSGAGRVTIETGNVSFQEEDCAEHSGIVPGDFVLLAVSDDGCGMDKGTLANIFEPFFTTKGMSGGTGLGLSTVYGIVRQNNGFISVTSEPGRETSFKIHFPRHTGMEETVWDGVLGEISPGRGETVLLVEDEAAIMNMGKAMLEQLNYRVIAANDPEEALREAGEAGAIDILITDVVMPGMNGRELAERVRALHPGIKILYMSGYTADVIAHHVVEDGVHFLQKPFTLRDLSLQTRKALKAGK